MPTFIDESGTTGPYLDPTSRHFRLAAVWVPSLGSTEAIRQEIREVRRVLGLRSDFEFKFSKTWSHPDRRAAFFEAALNHDFRFAFSAIDKGRPEWREAEKPHILWATVVDLAATLRPTYLAAVRARLATGLSGPLHELVVVDDNRDGRFLELITDKFRELGSRKSPREYLVGKVRFGGSKKS